MAESNKLFSDFPIVTKEEWLEKVSKDLKGRPLEELSWQLEEQISLDPFYHPDDKIKGADRIFEEKGTNNWQIGEYIEVDAPLMANERVLEGLQGGVEAPLFRMSRQLRDEDLIDLLKDIDFSIISTHFCQYFAGKDPRRLFEQWVAYLNKNDWDLKKIKGSLDFDPFLDWTTPPLQELSELIRFSSREMPLFHVVQVNARRFHTGIENISRELAFTIAKGGEYLAQLEKLEVDPEKANQHMVFSISISNSYFVEIAKLRALRMLWANVLDGFGVKDNQTIEIEAHFARESQVSDPHNNMIRAATQAMSAVIGGVDRLYVLPSNVKRKEPSTAFSRRIARNVQHILKMESYLDRVIDPAGGSYYIERLTEKYAEVAWTKFQEIEGKGGFMNFV